MTETATVIASAGKPDAAPRATDGFRSDVQALRALAVLGVVLFHLWPGRLHGGYAGVDVFFVISGFLITSHLAREVAATGRVRLARFWARRIRRLLPAALFVLALTAVATYLWVPRTFWTQHLWEILASATYWENWRLAGQAVDYLGAENAPSSVQHYWSLSVEEQFYILWPLLLVAALVIARLIRADRRKAMLVALAVVGVVGLGASIWLTVADPAAAYFVTPTRMWEFAAGGLLAFAPAAVRVAPGAVRATVAWAGWIAIAATFLLYTADTPFPGYTALLPVAGTAAVIWAGPADRGVRDRICSLAPVQFTGNVSYSLYLWHWPLIVIGTYVLGRPATFLERVVLLAVCFGLAALSLRLIEDPIRKNRWLAARTGLTYALAGVAMAAVCAVALWGIVTAQRSLEQSEEQTTELVADDGCFGAAATLGSRQPCTDPALDGVLLPQPAAMKNDIGSAYDCYVTHRTADVKSCTYGSTRPDALKVALVGDSHAASLLPGLKDRLSEANWSLDTYVGRNCTWQTPSASDDPDCRGNREGVQRALEQGGYDLVLVSERRSLDLPADSANPAAKAKADAWAPLLAKGTVVIALADNPRLSDATVDCIAAAEDFDQASRCSERRSIGLGKSDPLPEAVALAGKGAHLLDYTDLFCDEDSCPAVIGHVIVYRDPSHITATFSRTFAPFLVRDVERILATAGKTAGATAGTAAG